MIIWRECSPLRLRWRTTVRERCLYCTLAFTRIYYSTWAFGVLYSPTWLWLYCTLVRERWLDYTPIRERFRSPLPPLERMLQPRSILLGTHYTLLYLWILSFYFFFGSGSTDHHIQIRLLLPAVATPYLLQTVRVNTESDMIASWEMDPYIGQRLLSARIYIIWSPAPCGDRLQGVRIPLGSSLRLGGGVTGHFRWMFAEHYFVLIGLCFNFNYISLSQP